MGRDKRMVFLNRIFTALLSQAFLLKILTIAGIFSLLNFSINGVHINHYVTSTYGPFQIEAVLKDKR